MSRKMYEIQFRITSSPEGESPDPRMINIGLEGINIVDAIMALENGSPRRDGSGYLFCKARTDDASHRTRHYCW